MMFSVLFQELVDIKKTMGRVIEISTQDYEIRLEVLIKETFH